MKARNQAKNQLSSIWNLRFMRLGSVELMGVQTNIFYLKPIWWNPLDSLMKYYLLFEKCFSVLLGYLLFKRSTAFQIILLKKEIWITIPQSKKLKNRGLFNSFSPTPPKGGSAKVPSAGSHFGGTFALPSSGGHPSPGVNVVLILYNFPAKTTTMAVGQKIFE